MYTRSLETWPLDNILDSENVRTNPPKDVYVDSFIGVGLLDPLMVNGDDGKVIKGHLRRYSLLTMRTEYPDAFNKWFSDGIPVIVINGASPEEIAILTMDHGLIEALNTRWDLQVCGNFAFSHGMSEDAATRHLQPLMDRIIPVRGAKAVEFSKIEDDAERREKYFLYRRGTIQQIHNAARNPNVALASLQWTLTGEVPEGYQEDQLCKVNYSIMSKLWTEFLKDLGETKNGKLVYSKDNPGPNFTKAWEELRAKEPAKPTTRLKSLSGQKMLEKAAEMKSQFARDVFQICRGEKDINVQTMDNFVYGLEQLKADPDQKKLWHTVVKVFAEYNKS